MKEKHYPALCNIGCKECKTVYNYPQPEEWETQVKKSIDTNIKKLEGDGFYVHTYGIIDDICNIIKNEIRKAEERGYGKALTEIKQSAIELRKQRNLEALKK
jgi:phage FluMu protein Com